MFFANPWGLVGLAALPAIVALHLYRRRFPPLNVAGLHLWRSETEENLAGRRREQLPVSASLLLELLAALLFSLVLGEPRFGDFDKALHLVAVLDNSASMQGRPPEEGEPSFRDAAVAELARRMQRAPRGSVMTLILTGNRPELLAGPAVTWDDAQIRLAEWQPSGPRHAFEPAWDLGLQLVEHEGELLFLTDDLLAAPDGRVSGGRTQGQLGAPAIRLDRADGASRTPQKMEIVSVGRRLDNVAIGAARWVFDSGSGLGRIFFRVQNLGRQPARIQIRGRKGDQELFRKSVALDAGAASSLQAEVKGGAAELVLELEAPGDGLALDNRLQLVEPKVRTVTVANLLPEGDASRLVSGVLRALPDLQLGDRASAMLLFSPAANLPPADSRAWWLGIGPMSPDASARKQARDLGGPYLLEKRNPLLEGIVLDGIVWGGVQPVPQDVTPLVSAGNSHLFARLNGTPAPAYLLNIDLARSNLGASPDWPILLSNLVELRRNDLPGLQRWNYRLGEDVRFRLYEGAPAELPAASLTLVTGQHTKPLTRSALVEIAAPRETGIYEVRDGDQDVGRFAVNFDDAEESDLRHLVPGRRAAVTETASQIALDNPHSWFMMLLIALIAAVVFCDWFVLRR